MVANNALNPPPFAAKLVGVLSARKRCSRRCRLTVGPSPFEMTSNLDKYKADLDNLLKLGHSMAADLSFRHQIKQGSLKKENEPIARKIEGTFESEYQRWYTEAVAVIKQLLPDRLAEFEHLLQKRRQAQRD